MISAHPYAYLVGDALFGVVWLALFFLRKDLWRELLAMSAIGGLLAPFALIYLPDYWNPDHIIGQFPLGIEDFLFAFFIGGIGSVLYEAMTGKMHTLCECRRVPRRRIVGIIAAALATAVVFVYGFKMNSIYANYLAFGLLFAYIISYRRDLFWQSLASGTAVALLMFFFYQVWIALYPGIIGHWWRLENISGILIAGVPLEEILWGFSWGMAGGALYEWTRGISSISRVAQSR